MNVDAYLERAFEFWDVWIRCPSRTVRHFKNLRNEDQRILKFGLPSSVAPKISFSEEFRKIGHNNIQLGDDQFNTKICLDILSGEVIALKINPRSTSLIAPSISLLIVILVEYAQIIECAIERGVIPSESKLPDDLTNEFRKFLSSLDQRLVASGSFWQWYIDEYRK